MDTPENISVEYDDAGVIRTVYSLPRSASDLPSVYAFSLPKAGSVLFDKIMRSLSEAIGLTYVSIMGEYFKIGLGDSQAPAATYKIFRDAGYCYGGFRFLPRRFDIPNLATSRSILLVRDPRDMIVSHYFSARESHSKPGKGLITSMLNVPRRALARQVTVDEYALNLTKFYSHHLGRYMQVLDENPDMFRVFRYEDVIFNKRKWGADICETFGWDVPEAAINKIADKNDIVPSAENKAKHVRQVSPGDYKRKLKPETIERLTETFEKELEYFGYDSSTAAEAG